MLALSVLGPDELMKNWLLTLKRRPHNFWRLALGWLRFRRVRFVRYRIESSRHDSRIERKLRRNLNQIRDGSIRILTTHLGDEHAS